MLAPEDSKNPKTQIQIPDLLARWPWSRKMSPLQDAVTPESRAWLRALQPFSNPKSQQAFEKFDCELFGALLLPDGSYDDLRICIDLLNLLFVIDEYTDVEKLPSVREMIKICTDAFRNPEKPRPEGEVVLGEICRQFWGRLVKMLSPQAGNHFLLSFIDYLDSLVLEATVRDAGTSLTVEEYWVIRLDSAGVRPLYLLGELHNPLPDEVMYHPLVVELTKIACELVSIDNDILSYNREQASGVDNLNVVMVVMKQYMLDLDGSVAWLCGRCRDLEARYHDILAQVPSLHFAPEVHHALRGYLEHMGNVRRAIWCWSFESRRYFGEMGAEVAREGKITLIPTRRKVAGDLHREEVDVLDMQDELVHL